MVDVVPVYKVGIVLSRADGAVLIMRPIPKNPGEIPKFVLPRGSRQYRDAVGDWHDVRDDAAAIKHAVTLEPLARTLAREAEEEAGLAEAQLIQLQAQGRLKEIGTRQFASATKAPYDVHWYATQLSEDEIASLIPADDALEIRWADLAAIHALVAADDFSAGYVPVIAEALRTK